MTVHRQSPAFAPSAAAPLRVAHPALAALLARWRAYRGPRPMPERDDLAFLNLKPWHGSLVLVEVVDHGRRFRVATPGDGLPKGDGPAIAAAVESRPVLDADYARVVATRGPVCAVVWSGTRRAAPMVETLILPLAGPDGMVAALLVAAYASPAVGGPASAEDADQRRRQQRQQRRADEDCAARAAE